MCARDDVMLPTDIIIARLRSPVLTSGSGTLNLHVHRTRLDVNCEFFLPKTHPYQLTLVWRRTAITHTKRAPRVALTIQPCQTVSWYRQPTPVELRNYHKLKAGCASCRKSNAWQPNNSLGCLALFIFSILNSIYIQDFRSFCHKNAMEIWIHQ